MKKHKKRTVQQSVISPNMKNYSQIRNLRITEKGLIVKFLRKYYLCIIAYGLATLLTLAICYLAFWALPSNIAQIFGSF